MVQCSAEAGPDSRVWWAIFARRIADAASSHFTRAHTAHASHCAAVCKAVIDTIDKSITDVERKDVVKIEKKMFDWCATSMGKDKTMVSSHAAAHG